MTTPIAAPDRQQSPLSFAAGLLGGLLIASAPEKGPRRTLTRVAGLSLLGVAAAPFIDRAVRHIGEMRRQITMCSSIEIERSLADVFAFLKDFENFPRVIGSLRSVVDYQDGRSHWEAYSPSGNVMEWDAVVTKYVPRSVIAWESAPGSGVRMQGQMRFAPLSPTRTRVDLETTYYPERTTIKDALRSLLAAAPRDRIEGDLVHARYYLESLAPAPVPASDDESPR